MKEMESVPLVILGSSRRNSDTHAFVGSVFDELPYKLIDLLDYTILHYDYEHTYSADDQFEKIIKEVLKHETIVLATPVYWYSMSGLMKVFFDRLTDLTTIRKEWGKRLKEKCVVVIAVGADEHLPEGFELPFKLTAEYMDMEYWGSIYDSTLVPKSKEEFERSRKEFLRKIY